MLHWCVFCSLYLRSSSHSGDRRTYLLPEHCNCQTSGEKVRWVAHSRKVSRDFRDQVPLLRLVDHHNEKRSEIYCESKFLARIKYFRDDIFSVNAEYISQNTRIARNVHIIMLDRFNVLTFSFLITRFNLEISTHAPTVLFNEARCSAGLFRADISCCLHSVILWVHLFDETSKFIFNNFYKTWIIFGLGLAGKTELENFTADIAIDTIEDTIRPIYQFFWLEDSDKRKVNHE